VPSLTRGSPITPSQGRPLGNHRALLRVQPGPSELAWARVEWRLPGLAVEDHQPLLVNAETGAMVRGVMYASASSERGDVVFELRPPIEVATTFYLYYLPFDDRPCQTGPSSQCTTHYYKGRNKRRRLFASAAGRGRRAAAGGGGGGFRARVAAVLERPDWQGSLPRASVIVLEARTSKDAFHPMEVAVTSAETASLVAHASRQLRRLLVWTESREHPIRMLDRLPLRWLAAGVPAPNATVHAGTALRGEFYAFQLGVYAPVAALRLLPSWSAPVQVSVVSCLLMASDGL
jgi:hypothetical protein